MSTTRERAASMFPRPVEQPATRRGSVGCDGWGHRHRRQRRAMGDSVGVPWSASCSRGPRPPRSWRLLSDSHCWPITRVPEVIRVSAPVGGVLRFPPGRWEHRPCFNTVPSDRSEVGLELQVLRRLMAGKRFSSPRRQSPEDVMVMLLFPFTCDLQCCHSSCND